MHKTPVTLLTAFDPQSYSNHFHVKLSQLYNLVEADVVEAAHHQQTLYNQHVQDQYFQVSDTVWLEMPTA